MTTEEKIKERYNRYMSERKRIENLPNGDKVKEAFTFAYNAHLGQLDTFGLEYISHPVLVSLKVEKDEEKMAALLHDTLEDTDAEYEEIEAFFGKEIADAVLEDTRDDTKETYDEYIIRLSKNPLAVKVKLADLDDNISRHDITERYDKNGIPLVEIYLKAREYLKGK